MPKIDIASVKTEIGTGYPDPYHLPVAGRARKRLGNAVGLDQFGVNLTRVPPGEQSSQRHWHQSEDEFVYVLEGELVLLENGGETVLKAGDAAGWKAGTDSTFSASKTTKVLDLPTNRANSIHRGNDQGRSSGASRRCGT